LQFDFRAVGKATSTLETSSRTGAVTHVWEIKRYKEQKDGIAQELWLNFRVRSYVRSWENQNTLIEQSTTVIENSLQKL